MHIHIIIMFKDIHSQRSFRQLKSSAFKSGMEVKCQKVRHMDGILGYMSNKPRLLGGCNNASLASRYIAAKLLPSPDDDFTESLEQSNSQQGAQTMIHILNQTFEPEQQEITYDEQFRNNKPSTTKGHLKETKTSSKVDIMLHYMKKYSSNDTIDILRQIMENGDQNELKEWRTLNLSPMINSIRQQAMNELFIEKAFFGQTYVDTLCNLKTPPGDEEQYESVATTAEIFNKWCAQQSIIPGEFMLKLYTILNQDDKKKNTFILHGMSNAGKTYWSKCITPLENKTGQTVQSQDFAWQRCLNKEIITIPELSISKPEQMEEFKKISEGLPTTINIKNKEPQILQRTPIILQCNTLPWSAFTKESQACRNRILGYYNLTATNWLQDYKTPNPIFFSRIFSEMKNNILGKVTWPVPETDPYYKTYAMAINNIIDDIQVGEINFKSKLVKALKPKGEQFMHHIETCNTHRLIARSEERSMCTEEDLYQEMIAYVLSQGDSLNIKDFYIPLKTHKEPILMNANDASELQPAELLNEDYTYLKTAYCNNSILLMTRLKLWPDYISYDSMVSDNVKAMIKIWLVRLQSVLLYHTKQATFIIPTLILPEEPLESYNDFCRGIKRTSSPDRSDEDYFAEDEIDGSILEQMKESFCKKRRKRKHHTNNVQLNCCTNDSSMDTSLMKENTKQSSDDSVQILMCEFDVKKVIETAKQNHTEEQLETNFPGIFDNPSFYTLPYLDELEQL
ncbi:hypothetical protein ACF0H5_021433 [Mactra antiquata]